MLGSSLTPTATGSLGTVTATLRFAPSPNGRLHLGHAYSALLNARIAERLGGRLLLRIEDIDPVRSRPERVAGILEDLAWLGVHVESEVRRQSAFMSVYAHALARLAEHGYAYPCFCSRRAVARHAATLEAEALCDPDGTPLYPGTCRDVPANEAQSRQRSGEPHCWRLDMARARAAVPGPRRIRCFDAAGAETSIETDPARWGDAVVARRDVPTSYHLSVVIDDDAQGITHVVRGKDLLAATDLHDVLQALLGLARPAYHHHELLRAVGGEKLAKSRGSQSLDDLRSAGFGPEEVRTILMNDPALAGSLS